MGREHVGLLVWASFGMVNVGLAVQVMPTSPVLKGLPNDNNNQQHVHTEE